MVFFFKAGDIDFLFKAGDIDFLFKVLFFFLFAIFGKIPI